MSTFRRLVSIGTPAATVRVMWRHLPHPIVLVEWAYRKSRVAKRCTYRGRVTTPKLRRENSIFARKQMTPRLTAKANKGTCVPLIVCQHKRCESKTVAITQKSSAHPRGCGDAGRVEHCSRRSDNRNPIVLFSPANGGSKGFPILSTDEGLPARGSIERPRTSCSVGHAVRRQCWYCRGHLWV